MVGTDEIKNFVKLIGESLPPPLKGVSVRGTKATFFVVVYSADFLVEKSLTDQFSVLFNHTILGEETVHLVCSVFDFFIPAGKLYSHFAPQCSESDI